MRMFPARLTQKHILRLDTVDFFESLVPINQTVWNHVPEFIKPKRIFLQFAALTGLPKSQVTLYVV